MKKLFSILMCFILLTSALCIHVDAYNVESISNNDLQNIVLTDNTRATGLILQYGIQISKSGTTLRIDGETSCAIGVVRSGFKNLTVERRKNSSYSWETYYEYGNVYRDVISTNIHTDLTVESGYQYRVTCKHYAKKSLFVTQTISNTSNIVTVS